MSKEVQEVSIALEGPLIAARLCETSPRGRSITISTPSDERSSSARPQRASPPNACGEQKRQRTPRDDACRRTSDRDADVGGR
jgi:hypothetical protein